MKYTRADFPKDFLFGVAGFDSQTPGFAGDDARGPLNALDRIQEAGLDSVQFPIVWAHVLPDGRGPAPCDRLDGLDRLADALLGRGLRPCALLHHQLPAPLEDLGGWRNRDVAGWFADFTEMIMSRIGDRVFSAASASGGLPAAPIEDRCTARTLHHMLLAHGRAVQAMRSLGMSNLGTVFDLDRTIPFQGGSLHVAGAFLSAVFQKTYPGDILHSLESHLPKGWQDDFETITATLDWCGVTGHTVVNSVTRLRVVQGYTGNLPIYLAEPETGDADGMETGLNQQLKAVQDALTHGIPVRGYFFRAPVNKAADTKKQTDQSERALNSMYDTLIPSLTSGVPVALPLAQPVGSVHEHWNLVADIGGTNTRLGVFSGGKLQDLRKHPTGTLPDLLEAFHSLRDEIGTNPQAVVAAAAGPVHDGVIRMTNAHLDLSEAELAQATGARRTFVINDFTAAAWSVAKVTRDDIAVLQGADTPPPGTRLVVGPGTGLGVGALLFSEGHYHTLSGEGGHVGLSPRHRDEVEIFEAARSIAPEFCFGDTLTIEAEMFLSGTGLPILYRAIGLAAGDAETPVRSARDILNDAREGTDPLAIRTAQMFTSHLGAVMGDLAVTLMPTGGVFLVGGVAEKNRWLFGDTFCDAFNGGGRFAKLRTEMNLYVSEQAEFGIVGANNFCNNALGL